MFKTVIILDYFKLSQLYSIPSIDVKSVLRQC